MQPGDIQGHGFDNLSPYASMMALTADSPDELAAAIRSIGVPIKIIGFNTSGTKQVCYFLGNGMKIKKAPTKNKTKI